MVKWEGKAEVGEEIGEEFEGEEVKEELAATLWWFTAAPKPLKY